MDKKISTFLKPYHEKAREMMKEKSNQFLIAGLDEALLMHLKNLIIEKSKYTAVSVRNEKDEDPEGKIFFINLQDKTAMDYQALLYYYLELPLKHKCHVCLITTSSLALASFEKRVRSRFKHRILFVPYFSEGDSPEEEGLMEKENKEITKKYGLEQFSLGFLLRLFEPIHFALVLMAINKKFKTSDCYTHYKRFAVNLNELKSAEQHHIYRCLYDLQGSGIISERGGILVDKNEIFNFIKTNCPLYLRKIIPKSGSSKKI
ncbi:hypothetical protein ENBRE01_0760 [Enteropsectra breve]|nr:hypothetical protein ENBRE01_0760 [Enteropsectra breve]